MNRKKVVEQKSLKEKKILIFALVTHDLDSMIRR